MTSLPVMIEALVTRMVNDVVTQRRVPPFRPCCAAPTRLSEPNEAGKQRWSPDSIRIGSRWETRASRSQFSQHRLFEGLPRLRNAVRPKGESPRLEQIDGSVAEAARFHSPKRLDRAGLLSSGMGQVAGREDFRRPFFRRRPPWRRSVAPVGLRAFPRGPGLLGSEVLVRVVHQGVEPALRFCLGETVGRNPILHRSPKRKIVLSFSTLAFQETGAMGLQGGPDDLWKLICSFSDGANPQNEHVPFRESCCAFCEQRPGHKEGLLQGSLLAIAPYVEDEVCGVSFHHPRPISGGGRWNCWSELSYCTNSSAAAEERTERQKPPATLVVQRLPTPQSKIALAADTAAGMSHRLARQRRQPIRIWPF
jgi:hypothetical protein